MQILFSPLAFIVSLSLAARLALGAQYPVPPTWKNTTSDLSRSARFQLAQAALSTLNSTLDVATGTISGLDFVESASLSWTFILQDYLSNTTTNQNTVTGNFDAFLQNDQGFDAPSGSTTYNVGALLWGMVSTYAYRAYKNPQFLTYAKTAWDEIAPYCVTPTEASAGQSSVRSATIQSTCNGATTAGAVFRYGGRVNDLTVNGETFGPFIALSAYLFEATGNQTYASYAELTTEFVQTNMFNGEFILDTIDLTNCTITPLNNTPITLNTAYVVEGWSVLANVTGNSTLKATLDGLIYSAVTSPVWTNAEGINIEDPSTNVNDKANGFKSFFIRGLHEAWMRNDPTSDIAQLIAAYITVQFSALVTQSAQGLRPNIYSSNWAGPPPTTLQSYPQVIALHVLNPAFAIASSSSDIASPPQNSPQGASSRHIDIGAIVGGVVGGVVGASLLLLVLIFLRRQRKMRVLELHDIEEVSSRQLTTSVIQPFLPSPPDSLESLVSWDHARDEKGRDRTILRYAPPQVSEGEVDLNRNDSIATDNTRRSTQLEGSTHASARMPASLDELHDLSETVRGLVMHALTAQSVHALQGVGEEAPPGYEMRPV